MTSGRGQDGKSHFWERSFSPITGAVREAPMRKVANGTGGGLQAVFGINDPVMFLLTSVVLSSQYLDSYPL